MPSGVVIVGDDELRRKMAQAGPLAITAGGAALFEIANKLMNKSQTLVPVDTGVLRGSGTVNNPVAQGGGVTVMFGYGGAASDYAEIQHENESFQHDDGQAKYLQEPIDDYAPDFAADLGNALEAALQSLGIF